MHPYIAGDLRHYGAHVDMFLYCPYHPAGVVEAFARRVTTGNRDPAWPGPPRGTLTSTSTASWVIGDRPEDMGLARGDRRVRDQSGPEPHDGPRVWSFASLGARPRPSSSIGSGHDFPARPRGGFRSHRGADRRVPDPSVSRQRRHTSTTTTRSSTGPRSRSTALQSRRRPRLILDAHAHGSGIFSCGNGGSAAIANHLQCDHVKGVRAKTGSVAASCQSRAPTSSSSPRSRTT